MFFNKKPKKQTKRNDNIFYDANGRAIFNTVTDEWYVPFSQRKRHIIHKYLNNSSNYTSIISLDEFPVEFAEFSSQDTDWESVTGKRPNFCDHPIWLHKIGWIKHEPPELLDKNIDTLFKLVLAGLDYERFTMYYVAIFNRANNIFSNISNPFTIDKNMLALVRNGALSNYRDYSKYLKKNTSYAELKNIIDRDYNKLYVKFKRMMAIDDAIFKVRDKFHLY